MLRRPLLLLLVPLAAVLAAGCPDARYPKAPTTGPAEALAGLPPRTDPPLALDDSDDRERARGFFEAMAIGAEGREARRAELWASYQKDIDQAAARADVTGAFEAFGHAVSMWRPEELADETKPAPGLELALPTARKLYEFFSKAGADQEAVTALAVLRAADPDKGATYQSAWDAIAAYADDLEIARMGPGAERARPIRLLEEATRHFPSPWACRLLAGLYLDRQAARVAAVDKNDERLEGAHGPGLRYPIFNLVRAYARMGKLEQVGPVLDSLDGQLGDEPEVRQLIKEALSGKGRAAVFSALAEQFSQGEDEVRDLTTARRICETAERLYPRDVDPQRCLGITAARSGYLALAILHIERAVERAPDDHDLWSLLGNLYVFRMRDLLQAERVDAARAEMARIEKLHAEAGKKFPKKPLEPGLDEMYLGFGRGLYALGEIDEALKFLTQATKLKPNAEALELIALIELKRGQWAAAARDFEASAALPRETPLEKKIGEAKLLRQAADVRLGAGDEKGARAWWQAALEKWDVVLGSGLTEAQRAEALIERGRLLWALGDKVEARRSFEAAIDSAGAGTETQVYSDTIAFLFPRGEYEAALDAYHRGLARTGVTEYFKIYCSLWIVSAARLAGHEPDPLAMEFLAGRDGTRWYHDLARFTAGRMSWDELYAKANTRGKRAEAFFYQGMARYAAGDREGGDKLMRLTMATDMLGFFEYDMAAFFLGVGRAGGKAR